MATLKLSNYEDVFKAYTESYSSGLTSKNTQLKNLEQQLADLKVVFDRKIQKDSRKSTDLKIQLDKAREELKQVKLDNKTFTKAERENLVKMLEFNAAQINKATNPASVAVHKKNVDKIKKMLEEDDKKLEAIKNAENKFYSLEKKYQTALETEGEKYNSQKQTRLDAVALRKELTSKIENLKKEIAEISSKGKGDLATFTQFLEDNNLSTVHAEELFELYKNPNYSIELAKNEFKLRKQHPKRDAFLKKFLTPTLLSGAAAGTAFGIVNASGAIAGTKIAWAVVTSSPIVNFMSAAIPAFGIGAAAAATFIVTKNILTKAHYRIHYGNAKTAIKEYESENGLDNLKVSKLMNKINKTKDDILDLRTGNIFTKPFRAIGRTFKNIVNRNRVHQLEAITKGLVLEFDKIANDPDLSDKTKLASLKPIYEILEKIGNNISQDLYKSKIYALLTCKEKGSKHAHMIENADIYANLVTYLNEFDRYNEETRTTKFGLKTIKNRAKHVSLTSKKQTAYELLNADLKNPETKIGSGLVYKRYLQLSKNVSIHSTPQPPKTITKYGVTGNDLTVSFSDNTSVSYTIDNVTDIKNVELSGKNIVVIYKDNSTKEYAISNKLPRRIATISSEANMLSCLEDAKFIEDIKALGFSENKILELKSGIARCQKRKKPSKFEGCKQYKDGDFSQIYNTCATLSARQINVNGFTI